MTDKVYKVSEVAEIFGVSKWTIHNWIRQGKLEYFILPTNGLIRIKKEVVDSLLRGD